MGVSAILVGSSDAETPGARPRFFFAFAVYMFFGLVPISTLQWGPIVFVVVLVVMVMVWVVLCMLVVVVLVRVLVVSVVVWVLVSFPCVLSRLVGGCGPCLPHPRIASFPCAPPLLAEPQVPSG